MATGWDQGQVFYNELQQGGGGGAHGEEEIEAAQLAEAGHKLFDFLRSFREGEAFTYREQLRQQSNVGVHMVEVSLDHLQAWNGALCELLKDRPSEVLSQFEAAAARLLASTLVEEGEAPRVQVTLTTTAVPISMRALKASDVSTLVTVPGIVISVGRPRSKATRLTIMCRTCGDQRMLTGAAGFGTVQLPRRCQRATDGEVEGQTKCPLDPYTIEPSKSEFVDQATLKLQEIPESVPTGEMPRHILLAVERHLVDRVQPGTRCVVTGIYSIFDSKKRGSKATIRNPYLRVVGIQIETEGAGRVSRSFTPEEEAEFRQFARTPELYTKLSKAIAPAIFGHEDIKKALVAQLFGGSRKILPDGMKLRGDVNVLLMGDPSVAKSQFLKFIEKLAPIGVYTSGKGSSAAGLTASVLRDPGSGEFHLEGGAMVLADGGIVCIDEFDKMRDQDRVAIHEAMEQQTISIAKAGITTLLNSRTSVLAAANPHFGRYDDSKTPGENIDFATTILSRFDMIFIVRDEHKVEKDINMALHVLNVHKNPESAATAGLPSGEQVDINFLKRYIQFCRLRCSPRLSEEAAKLLSDHYVNVREKSRERGAVGGGRAARTAIPITVRQLEAIIRITESMAKLTLANQATEGHVQEAIRLFSVSTLKAARTGAIEGMVPEDMRRESERLEDMIYKNLPANPVNRTRISAVFEKKGYSPNHIDRAILALSNRGKVRLTQQGRQVVRV